MKIEYVLNSEHPEEQLKELKGAMEKFLQFYSLSPEEITLSVSGNKNLINIKQAADNSHPFLSLIPWQRVLAPGKINLHEFNFKNKYLSLMLDDGCEYTLFF